MNTSCGCCRSCNASPRHDSPDCSNDGNPQRPTVAGSALNMARSCNWPPAAARSAVAMNQFGLPNW
jgi:hypothetical protein